MRVNQKKHIRRVEVLLGCNGRTAFTFFEIMVTLVILSVGMTGIYRAFLTALNYHQHVLTRLHILNVLSDEFARSENILIQKTEFGSAAGEISLPVSRDSRFFISRSAGAVGEEQKGLHRLQIALVWSHGGKKQEFLRSSFVYVPEEGF